MITIGVILPQFTMIGCNRHRMGTGINLHYCEIEGKRRMPSREIEPATLRSAVFDALSDSSGLILLASGALVKWPRGRIARGP